MEGRCRKGEVVIELNERQIERVGIDDAHANEPVEQRRERVFLKQHLRVDARASRSNIAQDPTPSEYGHRRVGWLDESNLEKMEARIIHHRRRPPETWCGSWWS